ncbi:MAG: Phosphoribosylamine-glycine ligase [Candidatus Roizmanbacteria bacterium GW2011_GWA2_34_18]|uniref:Phosphoribosylamine--glycine ligase n=1 Tax=Candidatus Roizmanbacteria bacterium GW2011_GWA2_34_18 TaxID=1618477 RepID=A0A0G0DC40_9BACT|nr:MAG: Phosphoribosylamine-glycine ligase [Candidatus Roizmanbacteria bacterium GW2011_GWA2_34_18]
MKILIIGSGGREHALGWKIKQSPQIEKIYFAPGNPGTKEIGENIPNIDATDIKKLVQFAKDKKIDLTVVGPEIPLVLGIADVFRKERLNIIGPSKKASRIEGSKTFAKEIMKKYKIPTAQYFAFNDFDQAKKHLDKAKYPLVIKADGLCMGKGVAVCKNKKEAERFLKQLVGKKIIIEECLFGQEISFMVITDGKDFLSFLPSQDHKRLIDNDRGPNTGGMGAYTPVPFVDKKLIKQIEKEIVVPTIKGMAKEGCLYQGILYPGLILTKNGPKVLEYNCRFGDPETQSLMMQLESDLVEIFQAQQKKQLKNKKIIFKKGFSVGVILASAGYPGDYKKGDQIYGLNDVKDEKVQIFHAGTKELDKKIVTNGGRVLSITSHGESLTETIQKTYQQIGKKGIHFKGMQYRRDIGKKGLLFGNKYD